MSYRLTITYRTMRERRDSSTSSVCEAQPGRVSDQQVETYYVRDGALFYHVGEGASLIEYMVPLDLLYHYGAAELGR